MRESTYRSDCLNADHGSIGRWLFRTPAATTAGPTASTTAGSTVLSQTAGSELQLTLEELSQYTGQNGKPAYIAVDGVIYDVTNVPQWENGGHNGFSAGKDLTKEIKTVSPRHFQAERCTGSWKIKP